MLTYFIIMPIFAFFFTIGFLWFTEMDLRNQMIGDIVELGIMGLVLAAVWPLTLAALVTIFLPFYGAYKIYDRYIAR